MSDEYVVTFSREDDVKGLRRMNEEGAGRVLAMDRGRRIGRVLRVEPQPHIQSTGERK